MLLQKLDRWPRGAPPNATLCLLIATMGVVPAFGGATRSVTDETGRRVDVPVHPARIVSLAPSITETLYALGLGSKIVGDTDYCDYPAEAKQKPHVGAILNPSLEKIVDLKPDLVLGIAEGNRRETADQLARLGIPLYGLSDRSVEDVLRSIRDLGGLLDHGPEAETLASSLEQRLQNVERRGAGDPKPRVLFVTWYQPLITIGPQNFVADVIRRAGGASISSDLSGEWPRLSLEVVLARNPDVILLPRSQSYSPSLDEFRRLPGWRDLAAVKAGRVYWVSDTIIRPCPRLIDALEEVASLLHPAKQGTGSGESGTGKNSSLGLVESR
ncbi:MAG TPA: cobalamin-binding protein [Terriglobia bacterium]